MRSAKKLTEVHADFFVSVASVIAQRSNFVRYDYQYSVHRYSTQARRSV